MGRHAQPSITAQTLQEAYPGWLRDDQVTDHLEEIERTFEGKLADLYADSPTPNDNLIPDIETKALMLAEKVLAAGNVDPETNDSFGITVCQNVLTLLKLAFMCIPDDLDEMTSYLTKASRVII